MEGKAVLKSAEAEGGGIRKSVLQLAWKKSDERNCYDRKKAVHLSDGVLDNSQCKMLQGACKTAITHIIASYLARNYHCSNFNRNYLIFCNTEHGNGVCMHTCFPPLIKENSVQELLLARTPEG